MHDKITFRLDGRELKTDGRLYSGEAVTIDIHGIGGTLAASDYKLVIYSRDKAVLAVSEPFAADTASGNWTALINTATDAMSDYFAAVKADAVKTLGIVVVNTDTADTIAHGILDVISVPFAEGLTPIPKILTFVTHDELTAVLADYATHAELQTVADAAETAQDTATSALTKATSAWDTAVAAESAAETAQQTAETAQQTAETAIAQALSAQGLANVAQDLAGQAMGSAIAASTAADSAQQTADEAVAGLAAKADALHTHVAADIADGTLNPARLPIASASALGGIKVGNGLAVSADGTLSATGGGGGGGYPFMWCYAMGHIGEDAIVTGTFADGHTAVLAVDTWYDDVISISAEIDPNNRGYVLENRISLATKNLTSPSERITLALVNGRFVCDQTTYNTLPSDYPSQKSVSGRLTVGGCYAFRTMD